MRKSSRRAFKPTCARNTSRAPSSQNSVWMYKWLFSSQLSTNASMWSEWPKALRTSTSWIFLCRSFAPAYGCQDFLTAHTLSSNELRDEDLVLDIENILFSG